MAWKNVLYALLAVVLPVAFAWIADALPAFPLASEEFVGLVLWLVGLAIGGWQASKAVYKFSGRLMDTHSKALNVRATLPLQFEWKNVVYSLLAVMCPLVYTWLLDLAPGLPLTGESFLALVLWLVGLAIGGWQGGKAYYVTSSRLLNSSRTMRL